MYENDQNSVNGELKQPKSFEQNENDEFAPAGEDSKNEFTAAESEPNGEPRQAVRNTSGITMIKPPHSPNRSRSYTKKMCSWEFWARFFSQFPAVR